jgi:ankyrin repeat protein
VGVARLLRRHGCSLEHANRNGATPLYAAAQQDQADVVAFLLESGVAVDAAMADGRGPRANRPPARDVPPRLRHARFG